jgi:hypothetical protein
LRANGITSMPAASMHPPVIPAQRSDSGNPAANWTDV